MRLRTVVLVSVLLSTWRLNADELGLRAREAETNRWLAGAGTTISLGSTFRLAPDRDPFVISKAATNPPGLFDQVLPSSVIAARRGFNADFARPWVEGDGYAVPVVQWNRVPLHPYLRVNYFRPYDNMHGESVALVVGFRF